ncbi:MAG: DUF4338 domain-containing protein [Planctomycetes bacterium]|nr:DUF4338 domain-containing protein [Planctomycetota bacterium]
MMRQLPKRLCSQPFGEKELLIVRNEIHQADPVQRAEIARRVCDALQWIDVTGKPKLMSARKALLRLHREGHIELPPPRNGNGNKKSLVHHEIEWPAKNSLVGSVGNLTHLYLKQVEDNEDSRLFNALVDKYHYLGYRPLPGAQLRYLIRNGKTIIGAISFGGAAWKVASRDDWIGWDAGTREKNLSGIINNTRFLILPWIEVKNLASKILSLSVKRLKVDMPCRYGYTPALLETFVDKERFKGICYKAANWQKIGQTKGRGRRDQFHNTKIPVKDIYVYPLRTDFRKILGGADG